MFTKSNASVQVGLPTKNHILNALPAEDFKRLLPELELFEMPHAETLFHPNKVINYVYFPAELSK